MGSTKKEYTKQKLKYVQKPVFVEKGKNNK